MRKKQKRSEEHNDPGEPVTQPPESGSAGVVSVDQEKTNPLTEAVSTAYVARIEQLATYMNSGRLPSFAIKEIKAKLEEVVKEHAEWEKANGGGGK